MSSPTMDGSPSTADELENIDSGIIDDQAIDREIAAAYNLPIDDTEIDPAWDQNGTTEEQPLPRQQERQEGYGNHDFDNNRQFDDSGFETNSYPPGMQYYGYAPDRSYGHDMNQSPIPAEACRGTCRGPCRGDCHQAPRHATFADDDSEVFPFPPDQRGYSPSTEQYHNGERDRAPNGYISNHESAHPNQPTHPMYQRSQQFSDGRHPVYEQNEYGSPQNSNDSAHDSHSAPRRSARRPQPNEAPSRGTPRPSARAVTGQRRDRYSTNLIPPRIPTEFVSNAALEKRGLVRGTEDDIAIRGAGINDPDNMRIVNMLDNENRTWNEISNLLNADHIQKGAEPKFTPNNVHNRYNRNAPVLCAAEGVTFVPIKDRKKLKVIHPQPRQAKRPNSTTWSNHFDELLVQAHNEVKGWYWKQIAARFEETGGFKITAEQAAYRMRLI